jgi:hypothetical protein
LVDRRLRETCTPYQRPVVDTERHGWSERTVSDLERATGSRVSPIVELGADIVRIRGAELHRRRIDTGRGQQRLAEIIDCRQLVLDRERER